MNFTLSQIAEIIGGKLHKDSNRDMIMTDVCIDNRECESGSLFCAIKGERVDGHGFVDELLKKSAALITDVKYFKANTILVSDVKAALAALAKYYRENAIPHVKIVCVTGSVGKTSAKNMIYNMLSYKYKAYKTEGNLNSRIGLPISVLRIGGEMETAVLEIGMSERGEIGMLSEIAAPDIAVITNIGSSHLETLGSRENIAAEKCDIVKGFKNQSGILILNGDDIYLQNKRGDISCGKVIFTGLHNKKCDIVATNVILNSLTSEFEIEHNKTKQAAVLNVPGEHYISNAIMAFAIGSILGVGNADIIDSFLNFKVSGLRQDIYRKNGITVIADCYNASPESMTAALSVLGRFPPRRIAVLGDMLELGADAVSMHKQLGNSILINADIIVTLGALTAHIREITDSPEFGNRNIYSFAEGEHAAAAELLIMLLKPDDAVLFKASRRMQLEKIIEYANLKNSD